VSERRRTAIHLFLMVAIGILLGLAAPFGSGELPTGPRLFFWVAFIVIGYGLFRPVSVIADWLVDETPVPRWAAVAMTALVASLPLAGMIGFALGGMQVTEFWFGEHFAVLYAQVAAIGLAIHMLMNVLFAERAARRRRRRASQPWRRRRWRRPAILFPALATQSRRRPALPGDAGPLCPGADWGRLDPAADAVSRRSGGARRPRPACAPQLVGGARCDCGAGARRA
jgi:hypothetical protein